MDQSVKRLRLKFDEIQKKNLEICASGEDHNLLKEKKSRVSPARTGRARGPEGRYPKKLV